MQIHHEGHIWHPAANYLLSRMWDERFAAMELNAANQNHQNDNVEGGVRELIAWLDSLPIG